MDSHTDGALGRLEVVETGRRRRWSEHEKARIVLESLAGPRLVSATARRHGISRAQLLGRRRALRAAPCDKAQAMAGLVPARVAPGPPPVGPKTVSRCGKSDDDRIEIVLARGRGVIVSTGVDPAALSRV